MTDLPKDLHLIIVRRGSNMRLMLPMVPDNMMDTTPFEVATMCVQQFAALQSEAPGRADMPLNPHRVGLFLPGALGPLDPEMMIGVQLVGQWVDMADIPSVEHGQLFRSTTPCCVLNLVDLNAN